MARVFTADFTGGAHGEAITAVNTGYDAVNVGNAANGSVMFDDANYRSALVSTGATGTSVALHQDLPAAVGVRYRRFQLTLSAENTVDRFIGQVRAASGVKAQLRLNTNRTFSLRNGFSVAATTTSVVPLAQLIRVEWGLDAGAQTQRLRLFLGSNWEGTVPDEEITAVFDKGTFTTIQDGLITSAANTEMRIGHVADDDAAWVGPVVVAPVAVAVTGSTPLTVGVAGSVAKAVPVTGSTGFALAMTGQSSRAAPVTGSTPLALDTAGTTVKAASVTGSTGLALGTAGDVAKATHVAGSTPLGIGLTAASEPVTPPGETTGRTGLNLALTGDTSKTVAVTGSTGLALGTTAVSARVAAVTGATPLTLDLLAAATKTAHATGMTGLHLVTTGTTPAPAAWSVWDGTTEVPATLEGVWDGTQLVPVASVEVT